MALPIGTLSLSPGWQKFMELLFVISSAYPEKQLGSRLVE